MASYFSTGTLRVFTRWALLECDDVIGGLYRSLYSLEYFYKPRLQVPLWKSHVSAIRGETEIPSLVRQYLDGMTIDFLYEAEPRTNGVHWWLPVVSPQLDDLRKLCGLGHVVCPYHLSFGNICDGTGKTSPEVYYE